MPASGADLEPELSPLFARLEVVTAQATKIEDDARQEAAERREGAAREASAILEQARLAAERRARARGDRAPQPGTP